MPSIYHSLEDFRQLLSRAEKLSPKSREMIEEYTIVAATQFRTAIEACEKFEALVKAPTLRLVSGTSKGLLTL